MDSFKMMVNDTILREMFVPLIMTTITILIIIVITIILVKTSLKRSDENEKK